MTEAQNQTLRDSSYPTVRELPLDSWREITEAFNYLSRHAWLFRGQERTGWELKTSLERESWELKNAVVRDRTSARWLEHKSVLAFCSHGSKILACASYSLG